MPKTDGVKLQVVPVQAQAATQTASGTFGKQPRTPVGLRVRSRAVHAGDVAPRTHPLGPRVDEGPHGRRAGRGGAVVLHVVVDRRARTQAERCGGVHGRVGLGQALAARGRRVEAEAAAEARAGRLRPHPGGDEPPALLEHGAHPARASGWAASSPARCRRGRCSRRGRGCSSATSASARWRPRRTCRSPCPG